MERDILLSACVICGEQATKKIMGFGQIPVYFCHIHVNEWSFSTAGLLKRVPDDSKEGWHHEIFKRENYPIIKE